MDKFLDKYTVLDRTPGVNDGYYLRVSALVAGQPPITLSNEFPAANQLSELHEEYGCDLDVEVFARDLNAAVNAQPGTSSFSYPF
ncbi:MAG: hypothetical protein KAJ56_00265 [Candidatus Aenigmarchaeota archaeon]|nr:hypothetical protein [Candidatus Aenigmarchaeota archaeon]